MSVRWPRNAIGGDRDVSVTGHPRVADEATGSPADPV
jgi:hypothetical protein